MSSRMDLPRIAILGAGPVGLEAALAAATLKIPFVVYERGRIGEHLHLWGHVRLFSAFDMNTTARGKACLRQEHTDRALPAAGDLLTGREHLAAYLEPLAASSLLRDALRLGTSVLHVGRRGFLKGESAGDSRRGQQPFCLLLRLENREFVEKADIVLDCTGTYGQPLCFGDGGIPVIGESSVRTQVAYGLEDVLGERRGYYADRTTLVFGSGYSAATTICNLAQLAEQHPATWILWLARGAGTQPVRRLLNDPLRERDQLAVRANWLATRGEGNVEFHAQAAIEAVACAGPDQGFQVQARCAGKPVAWTVDRLIANVGYAPRTSLARELQVAHDPVWSAPAGMAAALARIGGDTTGLAGQWATLLRQPEPNFFVLGAKSFGRHSGFLMRSGFEQVREVFLALTAAPENRQRFPGLQRLPRLAE